MSSPFVFELRHASEHVPQTGQIMTIWRRHGDIVPPGAPAGAWQKAGGIPPPAKPLRRPRRTESGAEPYWL
ncbi:MAG TPA: hypothetical protein DIV98_08970 [Oceanicaulis sp.]|nr:hypothetical protein [Oceanicaulis sp.]HBU63694.1 hypothetical protein [Oceanicaulis sp.]HCR95056.1 hypothetical protein [Oceanicaulis sp.]